MAFFSFVFKLQCDNGKKIRKITALGVCISKGYLQHYK